MMAKQDLRQYFNQLMITNLPRESFANVPEAHQAAPSSASSDWHNVTEDPSMAPYLG
jgi:hypothetical protein